MNLFEEVLPFVRRTVSSDTSFDIRIFLDQLVEKEVISKEYHHNLLSENDMDDLARKIALTVVEKPEIYHKVVSPFYERVENDSSLEWSSTSENQAAMDLNVTEHGFLSLLQTDQELERILALLECENYFPDLNNVDLEIEIKNCDISNIDEENEESYEKIAEMLHYVLDSETNQQLENLLDETARGKNADVEKPVTQKRKKRPALPRKRTAAPRSKRQKRGTSADTAAFIGSPPAICTYPRIAQPFSDLLSHIQVIPFANCLTFDTSGFQVVPAITTLPQQQVINLPFTPGTNIFICTASSPPSAPQLLSPVFPITISGIPADFTGKSIPGSPDRNSPFAPTPGDLPSLPESACMSQCVENEKETCCQTQTCTEILQQEEAENKCVESFKAALMEQSRKSLALGSGVQYTDVGLVHSKIDTKTGKVPSKATEKELIIYDLAEREQAAVEITNLFEDKERKQMETKVIALLGQSGMGKTVLVKKICQDWSDGKFEQFSFVFYFECSSLNSHKKQCSLKDFLFELSSCPKEKNIKIFQYIVRNPEKVLLIFDGFDEFQDPEGLMHGSNTTLPARISSIKDLFTGLFQKKLLRGCTMLITARPRDKFNQYLAKVDKIIEMIGFSPQQVEWYIKEYFKTSPEFTDALKWIKDCQYLFSYSYMPFMCRLLCLFCEANFKEGNTALNLSLADFFLYVLQKKQAKSVTISGYLELGPKHQNVSKNKPFSSTKEFHGKCGLEKLSSVNTGKALASLFSNVMIQNLKTAKNLMLSKDVKDKIFVKYVSLELKKRRTQDSCPDMVRRFLLGLLFHKNIKRALNLTTGLKVIAKKQRQMSDYFRTLQLSELCPHRLLELFHCVYETRDTVLVQHTAMELGDQLSFMGTRLTPPDVHVILHILKESKSKISLDLRKTGIDQEGLRELMGLENVKLFRASLSDTVRLWKSLQANEDYGLLKLSIKKFTINPFKAESMKDVIDLLDLVNTQKHFCSCFPESTDDIGDIPAVQNLKKIEFALGKSQGQEGFLKLVEILPQFPTLLHLDLHALSENHIGDKGAGKLAEILPELQSLETLDLSQNKITDKGAEKLAAALPCLSSLQTLSLYNNFVCDTGAVHLAEILPKMSSLEELHLECNLVTAIGAQKLTESLRICPKMKSLMMYSMTIPHAVLQHLQQKDSRIRSLSTG
ncbi:MHC class II transactivator isoform X2 [Ascaphus truei]|uniref:MHC class II transactivator isoform X2 n=1 Tax=Ascaphus truei TaxID=8439 RepID=UPI003F5ACD48